MTPYLGSSTSDHDVPWAIEKAFLVCRPPLLRAETVWRKCATYPGALLLLTYIRNLRIAGVAGRRSGKTSGPERCADVRSHVGAMPLGIRAVPGPGCTPDFVLSDSACRKKRPVHGVESWIRAGLFRRRHPATWIRSRSAAVARRRFRLLRPATLCGRSDTPLEPGEGRSSMLCPMAGPPGNRVILWTSATSDDTMMDKCQVARGVGWNQASGT